MVDTNSRGMGTGFPVPRYPVHSKANLSYRAARAANSADARLFQYDGGAEFRLVEGRRVRRARRSTARTDPPPGPVSLARDPGEA